jgi:hypothetical protein
MGFFPYVPIGLILPYSNGEASILSSSSFECGLELRVVPLHAGQTSVAVSALKIFLLMLASIFFWYARNLPILHLIEICDDNSRRQFVVPCVYFVQYQAAYV